MYKTIEIKMSNHFNKCIYINDEIQDRNPRSIFHSPYKNGIKDKNFTNPSFASSDLFYPKSIV